MLTQSGTLTDLLVAPPLRIRFVPGTSRRLVVSLAGVGKTRGQEPPPEFYRLSGADGTNPVVFVSDDSRSWLNGDGMAEAIVDQITKTATRVGATEIVAIGNSMGATMALHLARLTKIDVVIAFVPQVSVDSAIVPEEKRWGFFRKRIAAFRFPSVSVWPADTKVFVLHGNSEDELYHATRFPKAQQNVQHMILPGHGHNLARALHDQGALAGLVGAMMDGKMWQVRRALETQGAVPLAEYRTQEQKDTL